MSTTKNSREARRELNNLKLFKKHKEHFKNSVKYAIGSMHPIGGWNFDEKIKKSRKGDKEFEKLKEKKSFASFSVLTQKTTYKTLRRDIKRTRKL